MAANGSTSVSFTKWDTLKFSWWVNSQSTENNTSNVGWKLELISGSYGRISSSVSKDWSVTVDGVNYSGKNTVGIANNSTKTLASGSTVIKHDDKGEKTFSYSFSQKLAITFEGSYIGTKSGSGSGTLDTIARASQPSLITSPENTQNVGDFGTTIEIFTNRKSASFTHTVRYEFGDLSGTIATGVEEKTTWKIPLSFMDKIPASVSGSGRIYVDTYNGTTKIGTKYSGFTAAVPASVKPSVGMTLDDITGVEDVYGSPVKGLSKIKATVNATPAYSSPIAAYSISANGVNYSTQEATTDFLTGKDNVVTVTATDKRGRTNQASYTMNVQDYTPPAISSLAVTRCNENGTTNKRGAFIKVTFSAVVSSMNGKNTAAYSVKYKKTSETAWTDLGTDVSGKKPSSLNNNFAPTDQSFIFAAVAGNSFDIMVSAVDRHNSSNPATKSAKAPTASAILSWRGFKNSSGNKEDGLGIGKVPEKANTLHVAWDAEFDKNVVRTGNRYCFSTPGIAGKAGFIKMARLTHKKANADTPITFVFTRRLCPHPMTVHVQFRTDSTTIDPDLKTISYEGNNYGAFLVKAQESVWDLYVQKVSAYDTITLQDWFSTATVDDRLTVEFPGDLVETSEPADLGTYYRATPAKLDSLLDHIFPVGIVISLANSANPADLWGGTWQTVTSTTGTGWKRTG